MKKILIGVPIFIFLLIVSSLSSTSKVFAQCYCNGSQSCTIGVSSCTACIPSSQPGCSNECVNGTSSSVWNSITGTFTCHCNTPSCGGGGCSCSDANPVAGSLISPANNDLIRGRSIAFSWSAPSNWGKTASSNNCTACNNNNTNRYRLYLMQHTNWVNAGSPSNLTTRITETTSTSFTQVVSTPGINYVWQVGYSNGSREVRTSIRSFRVNGPPTASVGVVGGAPVSYCVGNEYNFFSNASDADNNIIANVLWRQRGTNITEMDRVTCAPSGNCNQNSVSWTPGASDVGTWLIYPYAWDNMTVANPDTDQWNVHSRCAGFSLVNWSDCGSSDNLTVNVSAMSNPTVPTLSSPANGATNQPLRPTVQWNHNGSFGSTCGVTQLNQFRTEYRPVGTATWSAPQIYTGSTARSTPMPEAVGSSLSEGASYEWRTCALNGQNSADSACSPIWSFTTCANSMPGNPALNPVSFTNTVASTNGVNFSWTGVNFGSLCAGVIPSSQYRVYVREESPNNTPYGIYTTQTSGTSANNAFQCNRGRTYRWKVTAFNGALESAGTEGTFTCPGLVTGLIYNATTLASCPAGAPSNSNVFTAANGPITINTSGFSGFPGYSITREFEPSFITASPGRNYRVDGLDLATGGISASNITSPNQNFYWRLRCGGTNFRPVTISAVSAYQNNVHLGYELVSTGWTTSVTGDVYANDIDMGVPTSTQASATGSGFTNNLVNRLGNSGGTGFSSDGLDVRDINNTLLISEDSNRSANSLEINHDETWIAKSFSFDPPVTANAINNCNPGNFPALNPSVVYRMTSGCLDDILQASTNINYSLTTDGIAVVYVVNNGDPVIFGKGDGTVGSGATFIASNSNRKILFIFGEGVSVIVSRELGSPTINRSTGTPHINAALIAHDTISFEGTTDALNDPDLSVMVDGPLVALGGLNFERDRGASNSYPAHAVRYDVLYLRSLTERERNAAVNNSTGLSLINIKWEVED